MSICKLILFGVFLLNFELDVLKALNFKPFFSQVLQITLYFLYYIILAFVPLKDLNFILLILVAKKILQLYLLGFNFYLGYLSYRLKIHVELFFHSEGLYLGPFRQIYFVKFRLKITLPCILGQRAAVNLQFPVHFFLFEILENQRLILLSIEGHILL